MCDIRINNDRWDQGENKNLMIWVEGITNSMK